MYSAHKNVQIIIALLKKHNIKHIVCSAGTRNISFVFSVLRDDHFQCYSIVDERSAAFFALGLIQELQEPVAVVCTSGTAACNYLSAVTEAYYQHLPLLVLTSDRLRYHLNQQEDQCIPQLNLYHDVIRKVVDLPVVHNEMDEWYCGRLVNEALLELNHRDRGPVQINFQVDPKYPLIGGDFILNQNQLPNVIKIERIKADSDEYEWELLSKKLQNKRILLVYGQHLPITDSETMIINDFCEKYDVVFISEHISNLHVKNRIKSSIILNLINWDDVKPDIVITMGGNRMADPKEHIRKFKDIEHWHVSGDGVVSDAFKFQNKIIECRPLFFFMKMNHYGTESNHPYLDTWRAIESSKLPNEPYAENFEYSAVYAIKKLLENIPEKSILHISNSNSIRIATSFNIREDIKVYCNRGACGIDGSLSTYIAQSYISKSLSFMVVGDLSFFYDMNALWNKYVCPNTRIMLINNSGGAILNFGLYKSVNLGGAPVNTGAEHSTTAKGWVESRGFKYLAAHNKKDFNIVFEEFLNVDSTSPMLLEVFTDMDIDIEEKNKIANYYSSETDKRINNIKQSIPEPMKKFIKKIIKK